MENKPKSVNVNCSFCGKEIECPENMLEKSKKHMCYECFQNLRDKPPSEEMSNIHIDIPTDKLLDEVMPEAMTSQIVEDIFPQIWKGSKEKLKVLSKKEIAEAMFGEGAFTAINTLMRIIRESMEEKKIVEEK